MKRNLIIIAILFLAGVAGYLYISRDKGYFDKDTSLYKAIPVSFPVFFEFSSIHSLPFDNPIVKEFVNSETVKSYLLLLQQTDSLIKNSGEISGGLRNSSFLLSYGFTGRNELFPLIITKAESNSRKSNIEKLIQILYPPEKYSYREKEYGKHKITEIVIGNNRESLYYSFADRLFLISSKALLVEQSLRQLATNGILQDRYFSEVNKTADARDLSVYVNHKNFPDLLVNILSRQSRDVTDEFGEMSRYNAYKGAEKFGAFAAWTELDFRFRDDHLILSGISVEDDSLNHFLSVFAGQQPVNYHADEVLPQNTSFFCSYSFSDKETFFSSLENYFTHSGSYYEREERMKRFEKGLKANMPDVFQELVKDEIIVATTTIPVDPVDKTVFFIIHTEGKTNAEEQLRNLLISYASGSNTDIKNYQLSYNVDDEVNFSVYRFPYPSLPGIWLGQPFSMAEAKFVAFYNNFMVFSNSEEGLHQYLRNMVLGTTLAGDLRYMRFKKNISGRTNINVYVDINKAYGFGPEILKESLLKELKDNEESMRKFSALSWQVQHDKYIFFNALSLAYNPDLKEEAQTTWQSTLGSDIAFKPRLVVNHDDPDNREIIIQDKNNNIHQLTAEGRIRWSLSLPGPVLSDIFQIDYYKNGNLQYLFNTRENLYIIDRNGNNVAHFPIKLRSPATNGVNVFDYDNNRNYRYFLAGEDRKIYVYDYSGNIVEGWKFEQTDHEVTTPVQHFRVGGRDYIVFKDESRIYILDRRGEERVAVSAKFENSENPLVLNLDGTPKIVATDKTGKVYYLYFNGKFDEKKTAGFSDRHYFTVDDLDGDKIPDFVFVDGSEITVVDENGKKKFSKKLDDIVNFPPNIYTFSANLKMVGIVDSDKNLIYLFNPDGKLHPGFPLQGNSEFTIGKLSDNSEGLNLIVGSEGGKLYNYTLN